MTPPFSLRRLEPGDARPDFDCADTDLNEFYSEDSIVSGNELLSVTYVAEHAGKVVAFFCVSNDAIKKEDLSGNRFKKLFRIIPRPKRYTSMPAVKIGRLGVSVDVQGQNYGTALLDYIKVWFKINNKTGCRFIIVDAYNDERVIRFYQRNEFDFLILDEKNDQTRLMYFDLIKFRQ